MSQRDICKANPLDPACRSYNILVLEAASYMGLMTADFVSFLEKLSYYIANELYCIPKRDNERIAMPELFDMISGSETGSLIGGALVIPNDDPNTKDTRINKWFASDTTKFFYDESATLYKDQEMPAGWSVLVFLSSIIFFSALTYYCFHRKYRLQPHYMEKLTELGLMLENYQEYYRENKAKLNDPAALKALMENNKDLVIDSTITELHVISIKI